MTPRVALPDLSAGLRSLESGFTLLEVTVALVLVALSAMAVWGLVQASATELARTRLNTEVLWATSERADELSLGGGPSSGERAVSGGWRIRWSHTSTGGWVEAVDPATDSAWLHLLVGPPVPWDRMPRP